MAVDTAGRDAKFAVNDTVVMTITGPDGSPTIITGIVTAVAYGTASQVRLIWPNALARNAGETGSRFFYKIRGEGFNRNRAYREETLSAPGDL